MKLLYGCDDGVARWVSQQIFNNPDQFSNYRAIGIIDGERLICGVVYSDYRERPDGTPLTLEMSIASVDKRWANRHNLKALFAYPFIQLGLERVQTLCSANEGDIMNFNKRLGFKQEGIHRGLWPMGGDAVSFSMLSHECKWIK